MEAREKMLVVTATEYLQHSMPTRLTIEHVGSQTALKDAINSSPSSTSEWTARFVAEWVRENWEHAGNKHTLTYETGESGK
jgi:hypothetical protein